MPQVVMGMFTSAIENMRTANRIVMTAIDVFVPTKTKPNVVAASRSMPTMPIARAPCLSKMRPAMGFMIPMMMAPGMMTRPDTVAE